MLAGSAQAQSLSQLTGTRVNPYREGENSGITQFPGLVAVVGFVDFGTHGAFDAHRKTRPR